MATLTKSIPVTKVERLRPFDPRRDFRPVADLVEVCFADTMDADGRRYLENLRKSADQPGFASWAAFAAEWSSAPLSGYVWEEDGRVVGNASVVPYFIKGRRFFMIANVAVHPDYRRRGIARRLTIRTIEHARQRGSTSVWLHVREENENAVKLYRSLGFDERACRTTWRSRETWTPPAPEEPPGLSIEVPRGRDWEILRGWLLQTYPPQLSWHMSFNIHVLHPGLWGMLVRSFTGNYVKEWAVRQGGQLVGGLTWQASQGYANTMWLAVPPEIDEGILRALLAHGLRHMPSQRPAVLDYPAHSCEQAFKEAGFSIQQTLLWMELNLDKS